MSWLFISKYEKNNINYNYNIDNEKYSSYLSLV